MNTAYTQGQAFILIIVTVVVPLGGGFAVRDGNFARLVTWHPFTPRLMIPGS